ncbi:MAG: hypothetical protein J6T94_10260 [Bacteroidaceae bacterium]|nr:hypothetical protein [Bacteroidaceae bacterium]
MKFVKSSHRDEEGKNYFREGKNYYEEGSARDEERISRDEEGKKCGRKEFLTS